METPIIRAPPIERQGELRSDLLSAPTFFRLRVAQGGSPAAAQVAAQLQAESRRHERRLRHWLAFADAIALGIALLLTVGIVSPDEMHPIGLLLFPAVVAIAKILGLYDGDGQRIRKTTVDELPRLAQLGSLLVLGIWLGDELLIGGPAGKGQAVIFGLMFVVVAVVGRRSARMKASRGPNRERCLFLGDAASYARLTTIFARHEPSSDLVGRTSIEEVMAGLQASPGNGPAALHELLAATRAHLLIIGPHSLTNAHTYELLQAARLAGARVSLLPDMLEVVGSSVDFDDLYGVTLLGVRHHVLGRSSRLLKRSFDVAGAAVLTLVAMPLIAVIAVLVRFDSPGPILFGQSRIGRDGTPFCIFKFRTMVANAESLKPGLRELNEAGVVQDHR